VACSRPAGTVSTRSAAASSRPPPSLAGTTTVAPIRFASIRGGVPLPVFTHPDFSDEGAAACELE